MEADRDPRLPKHIMPKMDFPDFYGEDPKVWLDNCRDYFALYKIPEGMWVTAARVHLKEKAARWYQAFKQKNTFRSWNHFCHEVEQEFGADDFRKAMNDLLELRQTTTVEEYTSQFQTLHYGIMMHQAGYDDMFFTQHYVKGLKEDIRGIVEAQMPTTVLKASTLAQVQQGVLERTKPRNRPAYQQRGYNQQRMEYKQPQQTSQLWRDRQLRDYRKANNLCYSCGEKYVPGHNEVCAKKQKPQMNALALNELDLDRELSEETLNALDTEDKLHEEFCQLSINAMSSQDTLSCVKLKARVKDKVMIILMDSGSSHSFISSTFVQLAQLPTATILAKRVKLANGAWMETTQQVSKLKWYCQGHTLTTDMVVIDMQPYDAILGYDWLKTHSPMNCDWEHTTITFPEEGKMITLQGVKAIPLAISPISPTKVFKSTKGNEVWAYVLLNHTPTNPNPPKTLPQPPPESIQHTILTYKDVFQDPKALPPHRIHDHSIPLIPGAIPINSRPYHYSPHHKTEIENKCKSC